MVLTSGLIWSAVWVANKYLMAATHLAPGIDLVFLPAGFRLLLVIVFGVWGAIGICLADPLMFLIEFGHGSPVEMAVNALISGFVPWLAVKAFCRVAGIEGSLQQLKPIHLPLLALTVSIAAPLAFNLHFLFNGRAEAGQFLHNFTGMAVGDFLGCLIVSVLARIGLLAARAASRPSS